MKQFSLSRIPHKVPFAIANGLTTYYSWVTIHPVLPEYHSIFVDMSYIEQVVRVE